VLSIDGFLMLSTSPPDAPSSAGTICLIIGLRGRTSLST
jgi:hypothetical protein